MDDLDDPEAAAARGAAGRAFVLAQHGASARTLAELDRLVEAARPARREVPRAGGSLGNRRLSPDLVVRPHPLWYARHPYPTRIAGIVTGEAHEWT